MHDWTCGSKDSIQKRSLTWHLRATCGRLDVVINNAGVEAGAKTYAMIDEDDWDYRAWIPT